MSSIPSPTDFGQPPIPVDSNTSPSHILSLDSPRKKKKKKRRREDEHEAEDGEEALKERKTKRKKRRRERDGAEEPGVLEPTPVSLPTHVTDTLSSSCLVQCPK